MDKSIREGTVALRENTYIRRYSDKGQLQTLMLMVKLGLPTKSIHLQRAVNFILDHKYHSGWIRLILETTRTRKALYHLAQHGIIDLAKGSNLRFRSCAVRIRPETRELFPPYQGATVLINKKSLNETVGRFHKIQRYMKTLEGVKIVTCDRAIDSIVFRFGTSNRHQNGRIYPYPFSSMGKRERSSLTYDGYPTVELDYVSMHPMILYRTLGLKTPRDCYKNSISRSLGKSILLISLNARSEEQALKAIYRTRIYSEIRYKVYVRVKHEYPNESKNFWKKETVDRVKVKVRKCIEELKTLHAPISHYMFSGVSVGLMYVDSEVCLNVVDRFIYETQSPILTLHDSFRVKSGFKNLLDRIMKEELDKILENQSFIMRSIKKAVRR